MSKEFFEKLRDQSEIKAEILTEYFKAWASIMLIAIRRKPDQLLYIDLYSGPGYFTETIPSTPIKIIEAISENPVFRSKIKTVFNDVCPKTISNLEEKVNSLPFYKDLRLKPKFFNEEANSGLLQRILQENKNTPTLTFLDPFGYKGISMDICKNALENWGSDLFLMFNFNRIRMGLKNPNVEHLMKKIFEENYKTAIQKMLGNNMIKVFDKSGNEKDRIAYTYNLKFN